MSSMFVLPLPVVVTAQSLGVLADGNDHSAALAAGVAALPSGSTIYFKAGTYVLNHFTISNSVKLLGDGQNGTILSQGDPSQTSFITLGANYVTFQDMTLQATSTTTSVVNIPTGTTDIRFERVLGTGAQTYGINANNATRLSVIRSTLSGNGSVQFSYTLAAGNTCSRLVLEDSLFDGSGVAAPYVSCFVQMGTTGVASLSDVKITGNTFKTITLPTAETDCLVLSCGGSNANTFGEVVIADNIMQSTSAATTSSCYGIEIAGTINAIITGNTIQACAPGMAIENSPVSGLAPNNVTVENNIIIPNTVQTGSSGITVTAGASVSVVGNTITSPGVNAYGINVQSSGATLVANNYVYGNSSNTGIQIKTASNVLCNDNIIVGAAYGILPSGTLTNIQIRNNSLVNDNYGFYISAGTYTNVAISGNTFNGCYTNYGGTVAAGIILSDDSSAAYSSTNRPAIIGPYTVATLPAASAALKGALAVVTDATSPTWGSALTGSGSTVCLALCQGTGGWVAA